MFLSIEENDLICGTMKGFYSVLSSTLHICVLWNLDTLPEVSEQQTRVLGSQMDGCAAGTAHC